MGHVTLGMATFAILASPPPKPAHRMRGDHMPFQRPQDIGYGYVIERYVTKKDSDRPRYLEFGPRFLRPGWPYRERFAPSGQGPVPVNSGDGRYPFTTPGRSTASQTHTAPSNPRKRPKGCS